MADELGELIIGCRRGDRNAQRQLYERYHRVVYRLAVRMVGPADGADLTQEIFLRVFGRIASFKGKSAFATWLYRVATNECLRHLGRRPKNTERLSDEPLCQAAKPEDTLEQADLLQEALSRLDGPLRAVFLLREAEGLSYTEIARVLDIRPGTVASQLNRARAELRRFLQRVERGR
jgi:RNA polymerase sigma-70 factor (ECF subfamily)